MPNFLYFPAYLLTCSTLRLKISNRIGIVMLQGSHNWRDAVTSPRFVARAILRALAIGALLTLLPVHAPHHLKGDCSAAQACLHIGPHTSKAPPEPYAAAGVPRALIRPEAAPPSLADDRYVISSNREPAVLPIALRLMRLKLCPSSTGAEDLPI